MSNLKTITKSAVPAHIARKPLDVPSRGARQCASAANNYVPRTKHEHEALVRDNDWRGTTYRTGDGDVVQTPRPGSMDAYALPSRGSAT